MPDLATSVSARVRALRSEQRLTIDQLAQRSGVSPEMISRIERRRVVPSIRTLDRLAAGLGVAITVLLTVERPAVVSAEGIPVEVRGIALLLTGQPPAILRKVRRLIEVVLEPAAEDPGAVVDR